MEFTKKKLSYQNTSVKSLLGRTVVSPHGFTVGKVTDVFIDPKTFEFIGIGIKGPATFISQDYIKETTGDTVVLLIEPVSLLVGKDVISSQGEKLGKVKSVERKGTGNTLEKIIVKKKGFGTHTLKPTDVETFGNTILLKHDKL